MGGSGGGVEVPAEAFEQIEGEGSHGDANEKRQERCPGEAADAEEGEMHDRRARKQDNHGPPSEQPCGQDADAMGQEQQTGIRRIGCAGDRDQGALCRSDDQNDQREGHDIGNRADEGFNCQIPQGSVRQDVETAFAAFDVLEQAALFQAINRAKDRRARDRRHQRVGHHIARRNCLPTLCGLGKGIENVTLDSGEFGEAQLPFHVRQ